MPLNIDGVVNLVSLVAAEEQVQVTVKESMKGGLIAGAGALVGGLAGGPRGMLAGGILGSLFGFVATADRFVSLSAAVMSLPHNRQERIASQIQALIDALAVEDVTTVAQLATLVATEGVEAIMQHETLGDVLTRGLEFVRHQVLEEQRINPNFLQS